MSKNIGEKQFRKEDARLLKGKGAFSDDRKFKNQVNAVVLRSPHSHAHIVSINTNDAKALSSTLLILTGLDLLHAGILPIQNRPIPSARTDIKLYSPDGSSPAMRDQFPLALKKVRYCGEAVAFIVAESLSEAMDAAELIDVSYEALPANIDADKACAYDSPLVWEDLPNNLGVDNCIGQPAATAKAFAQADYTVSLKIHASRVTGAPMEPRGGVGEYKAKTGEYTLWAGGGGAARHRAELATIMGVPTEKMRVVCGDVGGNYGTRNRVYPEYPLMLLASKKLGRPVKWISTRSECMISDLQGRDLISEVSLALKKDGTFIGFQATNTSNIGGYPVAYAPLSKGAGIATGPYNIKTGTMRLRAVLTNTPPTNPYRSAGRPECVYALERLIDKAARKFDFDRVDLRRKNFIQPENLPYTNTQGLIYDSGTFEQNLDMALDFADYHGFKKRKKESKVNCKLRGVSIVPYIETSSGAPLEWASINITSSEVIIMVGTQSSGQGHETTFSQVAADKLNIPIKTISVKQGDTEFVKHGNGSHAGRSMRMAGTAIILAAEKIIQKATVLAAHVFAAAIEDICFVDGIFFVTGTNHRIDWFSLAAETNRSDLPKELSGSLSTEVKNIMHEAVFPTGCHTCEVEIDPETGQVNIDRYTAVDDVGRIINPMIVDGQIHGGIVQGAGQALMEQCRFDPETGQPLCGSFMDYAIPRADDMPSFSVTYNEVISVQNPLGVKSGGESGTTPAPAAVINAVLDALYDVGITDIEMPLTPDRVWRAISTSTKSFA